MDTFVALADPTRRRILELLRRGEHAAGEIGREFDISAPAVSQHLKVLRETRLVRVRVQKQQRIYSLDPAGLSEVDAWVRSIRRFWSQRLAALEHELRKPEKKRGKRRKR